MSYSTDLTDEQWALLEPGFNAPGKRGPKHAPDLPRVVDAMLYVSHTGCQWRYLPESFGPWTRVWSQFRRWSRNGTWARALTVLHAAAREADGRADATPSMLVVDSHLARGSSNGGATFHDRGGPYGRTKGAKRIVAVDVTGLPVGALVVPASTHENRASELMLEHLTRQGLTGRLELVLVDRGVTAAAARTLGRSQALSCAESGGTTSSRCSAKENDVMTALRRLVPVLVLASLLAACTGGEASDDGTALLRNKTGRNGLKVYVLDRAGRPLMDGALDPAFRFDTQDPDRKRQCLTDGDGSFEVRDSAGTVLVEHDFADRPVCEHDELAVTADLKLVWRSRSPRAR